MAIAEDNIAYVETLQEAAGNQGIGYDHSPALGGKASCRGLHREKRRV